MKIGFVGLGYVGLTMAMAAAARGAEIFGTEINPRIKESLAENRAHFFEPKLDEFIAKHNHKNFHCVDSFDTPPRINNLMHLLSQSGLHFIQIQLNPILRQ